MVRGACRGVDHVPRCNPVRFRSLLVSCLFRTNLDSWSVSTFGLIFGCVWLGSRPWLLGWVCVRAFGTNPHHPHLVLVILTKLCHNTGAHDCDECVGCCAISCQECQSNWSNCASDCECRDEKCGNSCCGCEDEVSDCGCCKCTCRVVYTLGCPCPLCCCPSC